MQNYWGYHLLVDFEGADLAKITSKKNIKEFCKTLLERIEMKAYGNCIVKYFAEHDPNKAGYSMVQLIETSSITAHFVDQDGLGFLDIFSCKEYNKQTVIDTITQFFHPTTMKTNFITRGENHGS